MKLAFIDALRGWAILLVIMLHTANYGIFGTYEFNTIFKSITDLGSYGVQLFFIVSAFTLIRSYRYRSRSETNVMRNFYIRRLSRIVPLYYAAIGYFLWQDRLGVRWWTGYERMIDEFIIFANATFIHALNPYSINSLVPGGWSISTEMIFYLFVPFLMLWITNLEKSIIYICITFLAGTAMLNVLSSFPLIDNIELWEAYLSLSIPSNAFVFGFGFALYYLNASDQFSWNKSTWFLILLTIIALPFTESGAKFMVSLSLLGFTYYLMQNSESVFINSWVIKIGKISYSMYVMHFITLHWMSRLWESTFPNNIPLEMLYVDYSVRLILITGISYLLSLITFQYIEKPGIKLGKAFLNPNNSRKRSFD